MPDQPALPGLEPAPTVGALVHHPIRTPAKPRTPLDHTARDLPAWLVQVLQLDDVDPDTAPPLRPDVTPYRCRRCRAILLRGSDGPLEVRADPWPLDPLAEWTALHIGTSTYDLLHTPLGSTLHRRWLPHLRHAPAGVDPRRDVVRAHRCGTPRPPQPLPSRRTPRPELDHLPDHPPY